MCSSIVEKVFEITRSSPNKKALVAGDVSCTYAELRSAITACASFLAATGHRCGDRISLFMDNSITYVCAYYGIISNNGVVVPLNTAGKADDVANWVEHSGSSTLITTERLFKSIAGLAESHPDLKIVVIPESKINSSSYWTDKNQGNPDLDLDAVKLDPESTVTIMYTSGTTGKPKGVTLSHGNFMHNYSEVISYLGLNDNDSILSILPFYYSYGNSVLHTHLMTGATIFIENNFMYPVKALQKIEENKISGFSGVPATFSILLSRTNLSDYNLSSLRYVTQAGGAMPPSNIRRFIEQVKGLRFFVMYGQTEATARISYLNPEYLEEKMGSVGKPLKGIRVEVRSEEGNRLGPGEEGELYISGPNIMSGYWKNPELTEEVLKDGFLKTGDLGHLDKDGYLFLTGRRSDMIKVGGNRISPLEIEEVVNQLDGIEEVAATGVYDEILGQVIRLTVVLKNGSDITDQKIKAYCKKNLAVYKIPKEINFVQSLPKTASGKIQRYML